MIRLATFCGLLRSALVCTAGIYPVIDAELCRLDKSPANCKKTDTLNCSRMQSSRWVPTGTNGLLGFATRIGMWLIKLLHREAS